MTRRLTLPVFLLSTLTFCSSAMAQGMISRGAEHWGSRILALEASLGVGMPTGAVSLSLDVIPVSFMSLNVGAGYGPGGAQVAFMPRFRLPFGQHAMYLGTGVSYGDSHQSPILIDRVDKTSDVIWLNNEIGYEFQALGGFTVRPFVGWAHVLKSGSCSYTGYKGLLGSDNEGGSCDGPKNSPYMGAAFGYRFL